MVLDKALDARMYYDDRMWNIIREVLGNDIPLAVEVGTRYGHWAIGLIQQFNVGRLFCVDPWPKERWDHAEEWVRKLGRYFGVSAFPLRGTSIQWAAIFPRKNIDLLYIDGSHSPVAVRSDLCGWWPKVRSKGLVICHDAHAQKVRSGVQHFWDLAKRKEKRRQFACGPEEELGFWIVKD